MESRESASRSKRSARGERPSRAAGGTEIISSEKISGWIIGRLPESWFEQAPTLTIDHDEILIIGRLAAPDLGDEVDPVAKAAAEAGRIERFREETREERMTIAREGQTHLHPPVDTGNDPTSPIRANGSRHAGR